MLERPQSELEPQAAPPEPEPSLRARRAARCLEGPRTKDQGPRAKGQGPRAKDQGPRAKDQGPRARGQGRMTNDQGSGRGLDGLGSGDGGESTPVPLETRESVSGRHLTRRTSPGHGGSTSLVMLQAFCLLSTDQAERRATEKTNIAAAIVSPLSALPTASVVTSPARTTIPTTEATTR
jgi:hypothetical protein